MLWALTKNRSILRPYNFDFLLTTTRFTSSWILMNEMGVSAHKGIQVTWSFLVYISRDNYRIPVYISLKIDWKKISWIYYTQPKNCMSGSHDFILIHIYRCKNEITRISIFQYLKQKCWFKHSQKVAWTVVF